MSKMKLRSRVTIISKKKLTKIERVHKLYGCTNNYKQNFQSLRKPYWQRETPKNIGTDVKLTML